MLKNVNRGYKKLRVWEDAVALYVLASKAFGSPPFVLGKVFSNTLDAAHSISRNIAEGYCRRSLKEYLNFLNISLGSCGEFHCACTSIAGAGQIAPEVAAELDALHFKVENELLSLIRSLQRKQDNGGWTDSFVQEGSSEA